VKFEKKVRYELDGGARGQTRRLKVRVRPDAIEVCLPDEGNG
jgi:diacylglycerol kinase family enzyme